MQTPEHFTLLTKLGLALLLAVPARIYADAGVERAPVVTAVSGQSDWSLLSIDPKYITSDGTPISIRGMPLAGLFTLSGDGTTLDATVKGILDADLDMTGTGQIYGPLVLTQRCVARTFQYPRDAFLGARTSGLFPARSCFTGKVNLRE